MQYNFLIKGGRAVLFMFIIALVFSCSPYKGYGVLVWKNENLPFPVGQFLNVSSVFSVDNYYEVDYQGTPIQVPMWQLQYYEKNDQARAFNEEFQKYVNTYVFTLKYEGLPIRSEPKTTANVVFILKPSRETPKIAKVLGKTKERVKIGAFEDYWYWILTEEGYKGYTFGYYLKLIEGASDAEGKVAELMKEDPALERFMNNVWRPVKTQKMVETGKIDMEYVEKNYGLIPKPNESTIILNNEDVNNEYVYTSIKKLSSDTYEFEGTDLKVQIFPSQKVYASYLYKDAYVTKEFVLLEKDIEEVARFETDRRQNILYGFLNRGKKLVSSSYGTIELAEDYRFVWRNFSALKTILPAGVDGKGAVNFTRFLGPLLEGSYEGAITFVFAQAPERGVTFVYSFTENGVKFVYAAKENIDENEIRRVGSNPLVVFFNFTK